MATAEEDDLVDEIVDTAALVATPQHSTVHGFDTAALFLLDLSYENLFEAIAEPGVPFDSAQWFRCKGCGGKLRRTARKHHHSTHRKARDAGRYNIGGTKMATDAKTKKPAKVTAADQGFPKEYLAPNGNFKPGLDARAKSDLVAAVLGIDQSKALVKFSAEDAQKLIDVRGWQGFVTKKKASLEGEAARAEKRKAAAATKAKEKAAAKSNVVDIESAASGGAKPDPKPAKSKGGMK